MPLIAWLVGAYLAGSLIGFTKAATAALATAVVACVAAAMVSRPRIAAACVLFAAPSLGAKSFIERQRSCVAAAARSPAVRLELADDAAPGGFARARACGARAAVFVAKGRAEAGSIVLAQGATTVTS